jgi:FkbM family methyltransferase
MMGIVSYAQNFEDVILWRVLEDVGVGLYIDIGAHDPEIDSVSKAFYEHGWRGIHVEPSADSVQRIRTSRPGETVIQALVAETAGVRPFYEIPGSGLSTACRELAEEHRDKLGLEIIDTLVTSLTLDSVLEIAPRDDIHWLKIDVEGYEREVLSGWQHSSRRPWVLVVEATYPLTPDDVSRNWEHLILGKGYSLAYRDGLNRYYLHDSQGDRKGLFDYPPNVFDGFQLSGKATSMTVNLVEQYEKSIKRLEASEAQAQSGLVQLQAEYRKAVESAASAQRDLERIAAQSDARQHAARSERLAALLECERSFAEKVEALRGAWQKSEAEALARAQAEKEKAVSDEMQRSRSERSRFEERIGEVHSSLLAARQDLVDLKSDYARASRQFEQQRQMVERLASQALARQQAQTGVQLSALLERERRHAEDLKALRDAWRQAESDWQLRASAAQASALEEERRKSEIICDQLEAQLSDIRSELHVSRGIAESLQKELLACERASAQGLDALRVAWRQSELSLTAKAEAEKESALEDVHQQYRLELSRLESELGQAQHQLQAARACADSRLQELTARERAHAEHLDALQADWRLSEAARTASAESERARALSEARQAFESERIRLADDFEKTVAAMNGTARIAADRIASLQGELAAVRNELAAVQDRWPLRLASRLRWFAPGRPATRATEYPGVQQGVAIRPPDMVNVAVENRDQPKEGGDASAIQIPQANEMIQTSIGCVASASLDDLLARNDRDFVGSAYLTILGRAPDPDGYAYYLGRLRSGISKSQILAQLRKSPEGAGRSLSIGGLDEHITNHSRGRIPVVGRVYRWIFDGEGDGLVERRLRLIENQLAVLRDENDAGHRHFDKAFSDMAKSLEHQFAEVMNQLRAVQSGMDRLDAVAATPAPPAQAVSQQADQSVVVATTESKDRAAGQRSGTEELLVRHVKTWIK